MCFGRRSVKVKESKRMTSTASRINRHHVASLFWTLVAVSYGGVRWPRKNGTNCTIPALTNNRLGSSRTTEALGTSV